MVETESSNQYTPNSPAEPLVLRLRKYLHYWLRQLLAPGLFLLAGIAIIVGLGFAQRIGWISAAGQPSDPTTGQVEQTFTCPMHPQIRQPTPGRCPICGMELVPATAAGGADLDELSVNIEPAQRRLANIETVEVRREPVVATIQTVGAIAIDESRMATIASYVDGRLERLFADYTGIDVAPQDHLAVVYSPELYAAQVEYIESRKTAGNTSARTLDVVRAAQQRLLENSRRKLVELGMQESQINELERTGEPKSRLTIYASIGGTVVEKLAVEGKYIEAGEPIYRIADLSTVWLMLELYPEDAAKIRYGQRVEAEMQSLPGEVFEGRVGFIDRTVNRRRRTVGVRVEFLNEDGRLRPGDYANATIYLPIGQTGEVYDAELAGRWISPMHPQIIRNEPGPCPICGMDLVPASRYGYSDTPVEQPASLYLPRSALLMAGDSSVVYVETDPGRFEIRPVTVGPILRDKVIVLGGVNESEKVATAGNFLIDSQMQLAGKPSLIDPTRALITERKEPLDFSDVEIISLSGDTGTNLESLFSAYFAIQQSLAADEMPSAADAAELHRLAITLRSDPVLGPDLKTRLAEVARNSEHLSHLELNEVRHDAFRPVSHAVVSLASQVRGEGANEPFQHMFCPMVKGGAGDWLQSSKDLRNPYFGSQMLRCGEVVREFPTGASSSAETAAEDAPPPGFDPEE